VRIARLSCALMALLLVASATLGQKLTEEDRARIIGNVTRILTEKAYDPEGKLQRWPEVQKEFDERLRKAETDDEFYRAFNEALASMEVSHLGFVPPAVYEALITGKQEGIGVSGGHVTGEFVVAHVFEGSPAYKAGLRPGDTITAIDDGKPAWGRLAGEPASTVSIQYRTPEGTIHRRRLQRGGFGLGIPDEFCAVTDHTAYLRIRSFMLGYYDREWVRSVMPHLTRYDNLILDLRENGGGTLTFVADLCGYLMGPGVSCGSFITKAGLEVKEPVPYSGTDRKLVTAEDVLAIQKAGRLELVTRKPQVGPFRGRLVLLFGDGSASAAEVGSAALIEAGRCVTTIGQPTMGAVLASAMEPVGKACGLQYPSTDYLTASGRRLEGHPIQPDQVVSRRETLVALQEGRLDPAISLALELLGDS
jgi:C-terminal processing protease CtpA/Prc